MVPSGAHLSDAFMRLRQLEPKSTQIVLNHPLYFPGLLQVEGYATTVLAEATGLAFDSPEITERVAVRMERAAAFRRRLEGAAPPKLTAIVDESVLLRPVGGTAVMRKQLENVVELLERFPTVELLVRLMRDGAHAGLGGPFEIHQRSDTDVAVFFEVPRLPVIVEDDPEVVDWCLDAVARLRGAAVEGERVIELIAKISASL